MRLGRRVAIDYGAARIGVAVSSVDALISSPLDTVASGADALDNLVLLIQEQNPIEVFVGLPLNLAGEHTKSTEDAISLAKELSSVLQVEVRMIDERLTTRAAQSQLFASGRNSKASRSLIDAAAATLILEGALAFEESTGQQPGKAVTEFDA